MKKQIVVFAVLLSLAAGFLYPVSAETGDVIPVVSVPPLSIPDHEGMTFVKQLGVGWNLGNSFTYVWDGQGTRTDELAMESLWTGVRTTEGLFDALKEAGFSTVRIPVSWQDHLSDGKISEPWLARVQEVVDWAYARGFFVILNTHHDEGQFQLTRERYDEYARYFESLWRQIAQRFRDYDQRLILQAMNEPRLVGSQHEWVFDRLDPECLETADCINKLNQLFVDTVRSTGGNNSDRYVLVTGYAADPKFKGLDLFVLPKDTAENRIILSAHAYYPYSFALEYPGDSEFGTERHKEEITTTMDYLYSRFIVNGIPVVIDEFGAVDKQNNLQARMNWAAYFVGNASARNIPVIWWDNNNFSGADTAFGLLNRTDTTLVYPDLLKTILRNSLTQAQRVQ